MARRRVELGMPGQGPEEKEVRGDGAKKGLLTIFKAVALKIIQASFIELLSHLAAPQDSSTTGNHQVANEGEKHGCLHLLRLLAAQVNSGQRSRQSHREVLPGSQGHWFL